MYISLNKKKYSQFINKTLLILLLVLLTVKCNNSGDPGPLTYKIGMMAEKFGDNSFNDNCKEGLVNAKNDFNILIDFKDGTLDSIKTANAEYFMKEKFDLLFYAGFAFTDVALEFSKKYPEKKYVFIDYDLDTIPQNLLGIRFEVQEAAFPLGFLAAYWADLKNPTSPKTAALCGYDTKTLQKFYIAFDNGVKYYNSKYNKNVKNQTVFTNNFRDENIGKQTANQLIDAGVSVIFNIAGECGIGALKAVKEKGKWGIGVDDDQYLSVSEVKDILLSSCIKNTSIPVYDIAKAFINGNFQGGIIFKANLQTAGVAIAPYHDYENQIPADIKTIMEQIKTDIISGKINPL
jgi:basic membrane protein A